MQSLQNQFVKAVDADGVRNIAPYMKIITCIHRPQPPPFTKLFQMQIETTDYCSQNFFENQSLTSHHAAAWYNGKRHYAGVY